MCPNRPRCKRPGLSCNGRTVGKTGFRGRLLTFGRLLYRPQIYGFFRLLFPFYPNKADTNAETKYFQLKIQITVVPVYCVNRYPDLPTMILPILMGVYIDTNPPNVYSCSDGVFALTYCAPPFLLIHNPFYPLPLPRDMELYSLLYKPYCKYPIAP